MMPIPEPWEKWAVRTYYIRHQVQDLDDLADRPQHYGIDLVDQAEEARTYIRGIPEHERLWAEGFIELTIGTTELFYPRLWDYVHVLWLMLVDLGEDLVKDGGADYSFPDQDIPIIATAHRDTVTFQVGGRSVTTGRGAFLSQLAEHGEWYFTWYDAATGQTSSVEHEKIALIREAAGR